jgi:hypothetical protein
MYIKIEDSKVEAMLSALLDEWLSQRSLAELYKTMVDNLEAKLNEKK